MHGLITAIQNLNLNNQNNSNTMSNPPFGRFMANIKFRSNLADTSGEKIYDAYIDSGATHHFFHHRSAFLNYKTIDTEPVLGATEITRIIGKGCVTLPIDNGLTIQAFHSHMFTANILSVALLRKKHEVLFSDSYTGQTACFLMRKKSFKIVNYYQLRDGLYPLCLPASIPKSYKNSMRNESLDKWHRKLGHISFDRYNDISRRVDEVSLLNRGLTRKYECVPCITAKLRRSPISKSTRKTTRFLELAHLDISKKVKDSFHGYKYTIVFMDDYTAKSDFMFLKNWSELFDSLKSYKNHSENQIQVYRIKLTNIRQDRAGENIQYCQTILHRKWHMYWTISCSCSPN